MKYNKRYILFCIIIFFLLFNFTIFRDISNTTAIIYQKTQNLKFEENSFFNEEIWIDANSTDEEFIVINGFLHGRDESSIIPNATLVSNLKPKNWRLYKFNSYLLAQQHGANITYGLSDHYAYSQGGYPEADPWENWSYYESYILAVMQYYDYYFPDYPVEYYDIWNEPDHPYFWHGTYEQFLELYYRAYNVIKSYKPDAKVVGPSISWYRPGYTGVQGIFNFLVDLDTLYNIKLDAISWHENGGTSYDTRTDGIPIRANYIRNQMQGYFPANYTPELHINEYMGEQVHLSPGWNVGFLYYIHEAKVDKAMRSCWWIYSLDPYDYWCDCYWGVNGLLMKDGETPQPAYWVNKKYADMDGLSILNTFSNDNYINTIATINESNNVIYALIGRYYQSDTQDVLIHISNYSYDNEVIIKIEHIPNFPDFYTDPPRAIPLPEGPNYVSFDIYPVVNESIEITIDDFYDGDAYIIEIYPKSYPTLYLYEDWNLITVPVDNGWYASDLVDNVSGCLYVVKWDSFDQDFWIYVPGFPAFVFPLVPGCGYFVEMSSAGTLTMVGSPVMEVNVSLKTGVNLIGWYHNWNTTASSILENISSCSYIFKWDPIVQDYWLYLPGFPAFDYSVSCGMGLFVEVSEDSVWHGEG